MKELTKQQLAVLRLLNAMDACAIARGEAQWTNGYRAATSQFERDRMHVKELHQWQHFEKMEAKFKRLAQRLMRERN